MKLIRIGDSLTFGYGVHLSQRWTRLCAQETGWELVNEGINGDTTGGMLARMQGDLLQGESLSNRGKCSSERRTFQKNKVFFKKVLTGSTLCAILSLVPSRTEQ